MNNFETYTKDHCWQYDIRLSNREKDLVNCGLTEDDVKDLRVSDFVFAHEDKEKVYEEIKVFIEKNEWLGRLGLYTKDIFTARYKGMLAGVVTMDMPNAFSKMLEGGIITPTTRGENLFTETLIDRKIRTKKTERLIGRGACISWSPKNLASSLILFSIRWMVKNTRFRLFVAYADTEAKELGTIYQACSFYYLGKKSGSGYQFKIETGRWVSDRYFRSRSVYKRIAKQQGIEWKDEWQSGDVVYFDKMPENIANTIKIASKNYQKSCEKRKIEPKHKYAFVLGIDKTETRKLRKIFMGRNKILPYPKERGK
jgi:hypothetical protein